MILHEGRSCQGKNYREKLQPQIGHIVWPTLMILIERVDSCQNHWMLYYSKDCLKKSNGVVQGRRSLGMDIWEDRETEWFLSWFWG
jgi:hypothetical protein